MNKLSLSILAVAAMAMTACGNSSTKTDAAATDTVATEQTVETPATATVDAVSELNEDIAIEPAADGKPTVIDFNATWCGPCKNFAPIFHKVAGEMADKAHFLSVDVDNCPTAAQQFKVQSIPQVTILKTDGTSESSVGFMEESEFRALVEKAL